MKRHIPSPDAVLCHGWVSGLLGPESSLKIKKEVSRDFFMRTIVNGNNFYT
jgi:hypothetical protein